MPDSITEENLVLALRSIRLWVRTEEEPNKALRGEVLHPVDAARDLFIAAEHLE